MTIELGTLRRCAGNHECATCIASATVGPSAKPSSARQATITVKPTCPAMGARLSAHSAAIPASSQRARTLPPSQPPSTEPTAKNQKKLLWMTPNCTLSRPSSFFMPTPDRPTTTLSAKFTSIRQTNSARTNHALRRTADPCAPESLPAADPGTSL